MKRIKLSIKTSDNGHYKYLIYRAESQEAIPADLEVLQTLSPIAVIDEGLAQREATPIKELVVPDKSKIPMPNKIPYTLTYSPAVTAIHTVKFRIQYTEPMAELGYQAFFLEILFNADGSMKELRRWNESVDPVVAQVYEGEDILPLVQKIGNTFFLASNLLEDVETVHAEYHIEVITIYDNNQEVIDGITYHGPVAGGLHTPVISVEKTEDQLSNNTAIPVYTVKAEGAALGTVYYYRIVAVDATENVSDPSSLLATYLSQETSNYRYLLESTEYVNPSDVNSSNWMPLAEIDDGQLLELGRVGTENFQNFGPIVPSEVPIFDSAIVNIITDDVVAYNRISLGIPNVWEDGNPYYNKRSTKAYRVVAIDNYGMTSPYSNIIPSTTVSIPIEKMVILRRVVTNESDIDKLLPSAPETVGVTVLQERVRKGGVYYNAVADAALPINIDLTTAPKVIMNEASTFDKIIAIDPSVVPGQIYNYTIYLYDAYMNRSEGIVVIASTIPTV